MPLCFSKQLPGQWARVSAWLHTDGIFSAPQFHSGLDPVEVCSAGCKCVSKHQHDQLMQGL